MNFNITEYSENCNKNCVEDDLQFLYDTKANGKEIEWHTKKGVNVELAQSYRRLGWKRWFRVMDCANELEFRRYIEDQRLKLHYANFCKDRLCPTCSWRRSLKIYSQASVVMFEAQKREYEFIFLTLTVRNCEAEELKDTITHLMKSFDRLFKRAKVKRAIKGWFRALEVTHNTNKRSKSYDTYHPHFHLILCVEKDYFKKSNDDYLTQEDWISMWRKSLKADYDPGAHIEKFKATDNKEMYKSLAEAAKYTVKDVDYIIRRKVRGSDEYKVNEVATDKAVKTLAEALAYRRLTAYGGVLKEIHSELNLEDAEESGDLIHCDGDDEAEATGLYIIEVYKWHVGYGQYVLSEVREEEKK